jgi:DeoR/GlpR family transcriptional regulator of sugar metabolism
MTELMLPERQSRIRQRLAQDGRVLAASLALEFSVSEDTIRRDLREMAAAGLCERVYGGALPVGLANTSLRQRMSVAMERKRALAEVCIRQIMPRTVVFFDAGSTHLAIAEALPDDLALTAVTNAPAIAMALAEKPEVETILIGGLMDRVAGGAVGARAIEALSGMRFDLCLIGTCGIDAQGGLSAFGYEDAALKQFAITRSSRVLVAATTEKFSVSAPYAVARAAQYHCLVVEEDADPVRLQIIREEGCEIIVAGRGAASAA